MSTAPTRYANPDALVSTAWLADRIGEPSVRVVDARFDIRFGDDGTPELHAKREDYEEGHIPGAVFVDVIGDLSDRHDPNSVPSPDQFTSLMAQLGIANDTTVVVYDDAGGSWGARLWWAMRYYGHERVAILDGGITRWLVEERQLEPGIIEPPPTSFEPVIRSCLRVTADQVQAAIDDADVCVVDALPEPVFAGDIGLYPTHRAGHVPGAINIPAPANLDDSMGVLPAEELARVWAPARLSPSRRVITYCGAGAYASFALFALHLLGHENAALYDASWFEWGADPSRPVETGRPESDHPRR